MMNNFMFNEKTIYSFNEVLDSILENTISPHPTFPLKNSEDALKCLGSAGFLVYNGLTHQFTDDYDKLSFISKDNGVLVCNENAITLLNKLKRRYGEHWAIMCDGEPESIRGASNSLFTKVVNLLDYTFPKYSLLLNLYDSKKSNMLDKLGRTRSGSREVSSEGENSSEGETSNNTLNLFNDTPQTNDVVATITQNQYVSELNKSSVSGTNSSSGSTSSSGTDEFSEEEEFDTKTIMEKLDEIQRNYEQIWKTWINDFDQLFIEEVNF